MKRPHSLRINRLPWQQILLYLLLTLILPTSYSCREKDSPVAPDTNNPTGRWVMYLSHDGLHLESANDTITVRVYDQTGELRGGLFIEPSNAEDESLSVGPNTTTTADTINFPWGTITPVVYWGFDNTVQFDTIYCKAFENGLEVVDTMTVISLIADF